MLNKMFDEFNDTYQVERKELNLANVEKAHQLIKDEVIELGAEVETAKITGKLDSAAAVKEAIDTIYITAQKLREVGVNVDASLAEVHRSNMSKVLTTDSVHALNNELSVAVERYRDAELIPVDGGYVMYSKSQQKVIKPTKTYYSEARITPDVYGE